MVHETADSAATAAIADNIDVLPEHAKNCLKQKRIQLKSCQDIVKRDYIREYNLLVFEKEK
jgi:hypothetical protein